MFFRSGSWSLHSDKDPRWNCGGKSDCVGGFVMPGECEKKIEELKKELGKPPDDLTWSYMKD